MEPLAIGLNSAGAYQAAGDLDMAIPLYEATRRLHPGAGRLHLLTKTVRDNLRGLNGWYSGLSPGKRAVSSA